MSDIYEWESGQLPHLSESISNVDFILDNIYATIVLKTDGTIWVKGRNYHGALGLGSMVDYTTTEYEQLGSATWTQISSYYDSVLAIKSDGTLWAWGDNAYGQLGLGDTDHRYEPTQVSASTYIDISSAGNDSFALRSDGALFSCGRNIEGTCGLGHLTSPVTSFTQMSGTYTKVSTNDRRGMALDASNNLWIWGEDLKDIVGSPGVAYDQLTPYKTSTKTWSKIFAGDHFFAIDTEGILFGFGNNFNGELGVGDETFRNDFTQIGSEQWSSVYTPGNNGVSVAIKPNGAVYVCGDVDYCGLYEGASGLPNITTFTALSDLYISQAFSTLTPIKVVLSSEPVFWTNFKGQTEFLE